MNLPNQDTIEGLHHKYAPDEATYQLVYGHCQVVAEIALWCADRLQPEAVVNRELLQAACLLHDIGSYGLLGADRKYYVQHALLGATLLSEEGFDAPLTDLIRTHILLGLTKQEIIDREWALPAIDFLPQTIEAKLLCYADRFHSKQPRFNSYETFLKSLKKNLPLQAVKFEADARRFGVPDIAELAKKYDQPIR